MQGTANARLLFAGDANHAGSNDSGTLKLERHLLQLNDYWCSVHMGSAITPATVDVTGALVV
jgi:hypothetical protein